MISENTARFFELTKLILHARVEPGTGLQDPTWVWGVKNGMPHITVWTRAPSHKNGKGNLNFTLDWETLDMFLESLAEAAKSPSASKQKITLKYQDRDAQNRPAGEYKVVRELWYGKNDQGTCWVSLYEQNAPKIVFDILLSNHHDFFDAAGSPIGVARGSVRRTLAMVESLRRAYPGLMQWKEVSLTTPEKTSETTDSMKAGSTTFDDVPY